jgi:hypothetical protein
MSKLFKTFLVAAAIFIFCFPVFAVLMGKGEVKGEVISSWVSGEQVRFRLSITSQKNWSGPRLGNPNNFVYKGADKMKITEGDMVSLVYNSSDGDYIVAESLEFTNDRPGEINQTSYLKPVIVVLSLVTVVIIVFSLIRRKKKNTQRRIKSIAPESRSGYII